MSTNMSYQKKEGSPANFLTIKENRKLRVLQADDNVGIRNSRFAVSSVGKEANNTTTLLIKVIPWLIAGVLVGLSVII